MKLVPASYKGRYFSKDAQANLWQARSVLTEMAAFRQHNLLDPLRNGLLT